VQPAPVVVPAAPPVDSSRGFAEAVLQAGLWEAVEARRPLHVPGAGPRLAEALDADAVAAALARGGEQGATSASKRGEPYMRNSIFLAYLDQAALSLAGAERFFPPLLEACEGLADRSFDYVSARLVLEPASNVGLGSPMVPDSEVLLVQLLGEQRLTVQRPLHGLPVTAPRPQPLLSRELRPGDAFLVPSGLECRAAPLRAPPLPTSGAAGGEEEGPVLYVLLTLRAGEQSADVSLGKYLTDLLREGSLSSEADGFLRTAVTKRTAKAVGDEALAEQLRRTAQELAKQVSGEGLRRHYGQRMEKLRKEQREGAARLSAEGKQKGGPMPLLSSTRLRVATGVTCRCQDGESVAYFTRGTETLNLPIAETASRLINDLSDSRPHAIGSLRCADVFERLCVCEVLVGKGCLEVC